MCCPQLRLTSAICSIALAWVLFSIVLFCFPTTAENTPETINYASVVVVFFACGAAVYYFAGECRWALHLLASLTLFPLTRQAPASSTR